MTQIIRRTAVAATATALAVTGALAPTSPASARPADCTLTVKISPDRGALYGRADVRCTRKEKYQVKIYLRRKDGISWTVVATGIKNYNKAGYGFVSTTEPCSDRSEEHTSELQS